MEKSLVRIGNSLGIVIDKSIRRMLGVETETVFRVSTDGRRILLEPLGTRWERKIQTPIPTDPRPTLADELDAAPTLGALYQKHGMAPDQLAQLHHAPPPPGQRRDLFFYGLVERFRGGAVRTANDHELATVRRLRRCLQLLSSGCPWEAAIAAATAEYPKPVSAEPLEAISQPVKPPVVSVPIPEVVTDKEEEQEEDWVDPSTACTGDPEAPSDGPCPCGGCATRRAQHG